MSTPWQLRVYDKQALIYTEDLLEPLELGRQDEGEEGPFSKKNLGSFWRLVVARLEERSISRSHVLLEPRPGDKVGVTNRSSSLTLRLGNGKELKPGASSEEDLPLSMTLGKKTVHLQRTDSEEGPVQNLGEVPSAPLSVVGNFQQLPGLRTLSDADNDNKAMLRWLQATMGVFQSAASSSDFLARAAQAVIEIAGMETARVLLLDERHQWQARATQTARGVSDESVRPPSRSILSRLYQEKRTFWQLPQAPSLMGGSLMGVHAVVAAPILDRQGRVIGALYGDRRCDGVSPRTGPITELEAMVVELLASGIAAGLARLEQEQAALAARVQFEQFFTPEFSRQLTENPDLLKGRDCEVTVLFVDIRGFSRISEQLGPARTFDWISDTLGALSDCVRQHKGVLVDYVGDELFAMWGAPETQPDHARFACQTALDMLARLPALNAQWQPVVKQPIQLGIGINTGRAWVGNTGSRHKFKYGPLGNTVNLGSRVQGATKYLHTTLLLTGTTHAQVKETFTCRRLCTARVVNIAQPVELYELAPPSEPGWVELRQGYEDALRQFEQREYRNAARILGNLLTQHPNDGPALVLLSRAVNAMLEKNRETDLVWELSGK